MKNKKKNKKFGQTILGSILTFMFLMFITSIFTGLAYEILDATILNKLSKEYANIFENYTILLVPVILIVLIMAISKKDKYMLKKFTLKNNKLAHGFILGFIMNTICVIVAILTKSLELKFNYLNLPLLLFAFISVAFQCAHEEIFCRLYLYQKIKETHSKKITLLVNSIIFGFLHIFNDGMTVIGMISIIGFGILMSMYVYCYDDIWGAIGLHTSWNFTQNLIYGMPNSGFEPVYSLFEVISSKQSITYNPIFGIEGTIFTVLIVFSTAYLIYWYSKRKTKEVK